MVLSHLETTMQLPSAPGAFLGYRKNGQPIYLMAGGSGEGETAPAPTPPTPPAPTPEPPKPAPQEPDAKPAAERVEDLPDWAQKIVRDARKGEGDYRLKAKEAESAAQKAAEDAVNALTQKLGKELGIVKDDQPPSVDDLTSQLTAAQEQSQQREAELRTLRVERAAERAAREHGADVDTLLDSRSFASKLADLDPTADDFAATVSDLVKTTVDSNPKYKAAQAATSSSADFSSGPGEQRNRTNSLHAAARNHYGVGG